MQRFQPGGAERSSSISPDEDKPPHIHKTAVVTAGVPQGDGLCRQSMLNVSRSAFIFDRLPAVREHGAAIKTDAALRKVQAIARGRLVRKKIAVATVEPGIVHVRLKGDADLFKRIGMAGIAMQKAGKSIDYLAIANDKFKPHLAGGRKIYHPTKMTGTRLSKVLAPPARRSAGVTAYINGYFYNSAWLGAGHLSPAEQAVLPEYAAIGPNKINGFKKMPCIPVDRRYESSFHRIEFPDGSYVTSGPLLADRNLDGTGIERRFTVNEAAQGRYQLGPTTDRPGQLGHAQGHHARSGISMPVAFAVSPAVERAGQPTAKSNCVRIAVGKNDRMKGGRANGFTMLEWASVMGRLGSFNHQPGVSLNLDGGASAVIGVLDRKGNKRLEIRGTDRIQPTTTSFVAFTPTAERPHAFAQLADRLKTLWR